ncbi:hypothetical protein LMG18090_02504 [Ralstonia mannitolilytica]|nr:hypothetical protein LMG18090_02504 [Ralstonia mannitolilytica]
MFWMSPCSPGMTIKEGTKRNRCRLRDNPEHRSNCLKSLRGQDVPVSGGSVNKKRSFNAKRCTNVDMGALCRCCMLPRHRSRGAPGNGTVRAPRTRRTSVNRPEAVAARSCYDAQPFPASELLNRAGRGPGKTRRHRPGRPSGVHPNRPGRRSPPPTRPAVNPLRIRRACTRRPHTQVRSSRRQWPTVCARVHDTPALAPPIVAYVIGKTWSA